MTASAKKAPHKSRAEGVFAEEGCYGLPRLEQFTVSSEWRPWEGIQNRELDVVDVGRGRVEGTRGVSVFTALLGQGGNPGAVSTSVPAATSAVRPSLTRTGHLSL